MFKKVFAIGMLGCLLFQALLGSVWVLRYYVKKADYIERCENRDKPKMACHGKCRLKKELQQLDGGSRNDAAEQPDQAPAAPVKTKVQDELPVFILPTPMVSRPFSPRVGAGDKSPSLFWYTALAGRLWSGDVFHPPAA